MNISFELAHAAPSTTAEMRQGNGLHLRLICQAGVDLAATVLEVEAGSFDEPVAYPGLAHFLEHLLFLGSEGFAEEQGLLSFVQGLGGRVNATTGAGITRFFFEVPATHFEDALERLLDMLARPLLASDAMWREREVLEAEYRARAQDPQTLCDAALAWALPAGHPLGGFHAGNASSLRLEDGGVAAALRAFHRSHFQAGRMRLTLVGPEPLERMAALAGRLGARLPCGSSSQRIESPPMLPLRAQALQLSLPGGRPMLHLGFVLDALGEALEPAVEFLGWTLQSEAEGGLLATLRAAGLCDELRVRLPYVRGEQALLVMVFDLVAGADTTVLEAEVIEWLAAFRNAGPWAELREAYAETQRLRAQNQQPLELALAAGRESPEVLTMLLGQLRRDRLIHLHVSSEPVDGRVVSAGFPLHMSVLPRVAERQARASWSMPEANPYARVMDAEESQAVLFLRWRALQGSLPGGLGHGLQRALRPILWQARQAGVEGCFVPQADSLELVLNGHADLLTQVAGDLMDVLHSPSLTALAQGPRLEAEAARQLASEMPIRQLFQQMARLFGDQADKSAPLADHDEVQAFWSTSCWQGLHLGLGEQGGQPLLARAPGEPDMASARHTPDGRVWRRMTLPGADAAVLLFYPLLGGGAETEAAWRLLGLGQEPAFHQRMRGELQLGYGLACGFRQVGPHRGLMFAVQSPRASVAEIVQHIQAFLDDCHARLSKLDAGQFDTQRRTLAAQLMRQAARFTSCVEQAWHDRLAGLPDDHAAQVRQALVRLELERVLEEQQRLQDDVSACRALANADCPIGAWRAAD
ncbi:pyrroloquinoline quinone biosynthesis protein PqqF [Metapseudomonas boanensis]|uniref:Coenzyme PQQ synthesis protein F n=1 Tax=Metapseudomonas boanensis TaxID=2822138 RepID=A0ABS5XMY1_9GAMM|nr:pyrroloquinoline quinone biosynthesis protein PqqF [Pseudomonas boanensis]MBT8768440.1 pyrroloquinoline quinone biosynthesis protein PqqF [Pseudomonas boanensis]